MVDIYDERQPPTSSLKTIIFRLEQLPATLKVQLIAVDKVTGRTIAGILQFTEAGIIRKVRAKEELEKAGYDTSELKWNSDGTLATFEEEY